MKMVEDYSMRCWIIDFLKKCDMEGYNLGSIIRKLEEEK